MMNVSIETVTILIKCTHCMIKKQIHIITGGPGFGKTAVIDELRSRGYLCSGEFAREIIKKQLQTGGDLLPHKNPWQFQEMILSLREDFYESVPEKGMAFSDRGIPDQLAFARYKGISRPKLLNESAAKYRYATRVFVTPPWPEIYVNDTIRRETYKEAILIHQAVLYIYSELNYQIIELPLIPVSERTDFIIQTIFNSNKHDF